MVKNIVKQFKFEETLLAIVINGKNEHVKFNPSFNN